MSLPKHAGHELDLARIRAHLGAARSREYWRSLEELAEAPAFLDYLHREFPENASEWGDPVGRRNFLKLMAASLALAGVTGCTRQPTEKLAPYVRAPEQFVPGKPLFYATAMTLGGYAMGLLAESHLGRPTKLEGNELHPASLGATDAFAQASILTLYDPDRSQVINEAGRISTWGAFLAAVTRALQTQKAKQGQGLRILTETVTSPTLAEQIRRLFRDYPAAKWHQWDPVNRDNVHAGMRMAFGAVVDPQYRFEKADVIFSLDCDFLCSGAAGLRYARELSHRRRVIGDKAEMNRLYVVESTPTNTGAMADHRQPVRSVEIEKVARYIAYRLGMPTDLPGGPHLSGRLLGWANAVFGDLQRHRGGSVVIAGDHQSPVVHALAHWINQALGNVGSTVSYTDPVAANPVNQMDSLRELVAEMAAGRVKMLLVLGGNPVYNAPTDFDFADALSKVPLRIHLSLYEDETSNLCHWHIPETHYLEAWGDARAFDGSISIQQPLIAPLYSGKSAYELLAALAGQPGRSGYDILRESWKNRIGAKDFEPVWRRTVHDGVMAGSALPSRTVKPLLTALPPMLTSQEGMEVLFRPDSTMYDGRFANNGWLQELPKSLTRLTWDNPALISPATAQRLGLRNGEVVELRSAGRALRIPVWIMPGQAENALTLHLGYGRTRAGRVGSGVGFNTYTLRTSGALWIRASAELVKTGEHYPLASTQEHWSMEGRHLVREASLEEYRRDPGFAQKLGHPTSGLSLYPGFAYPGYAWGMAIDLNACTGCNACVAACQAENNIPIVGKEQVARGREMHWLRVDRYYRGDLENPATSHQPVPCMHCENAPCEVVCPVAATVHSAEGLNDMVYNRCVGTRYCSNNCPYKVRRFNFFKYVDDTTPVLKLLRNPDVTVRERGVMEKCTYCVQRINEARIVAEREGRAIRDGEIATACQAVCPTEAIVFGNINDPKSRVSRLKAEPRHYALLAELNTRPRTTYLARISNPNPEIEAAERA